MRPKPFYLHWLDDVAAGVAEGADDIERDRMLEEPGTVDEWRGLELELHNGALTDYLANDVGVRLCSQRLRQVLVQSLHTVGPSGG